MFKDDPSYPVPQAIATVPDLDLIEQYYFEAFDNLGTERYIGMDAGAIPVMKIIEYGSYLNDDDIDMFVKIITRVDAHYLSERAKKRELERKQNA